MGRPLRGKWRWEEMSPEGLGQDGPCFLAVHKGWRHYLLGCWGFWTLFAWLHSSFLETKKKPQGETQYITVKSEVVLVEKWGAGRPRPHSPEVPLKLFTLSLSCRTVWKTLKKKQNTSGEHVIRLILSKVHLYYERKKEEACLITC